jgi:hypothetical protein
MVHPHPGSRKTSGIKAFFQRERKKNEMSSINGAKFFCGGEY